MNPLGSLYCVVFGLLSFLITEKTGSLRGNCHKSQDILEEKCWLLLIVDLSSRPGIQGLERMGQTMV